MGIRYRRAKSPERSFREGVAEDAAELEALVTIGTLAAGDEVAPDGVRFQKIETLPELRELFRDRGGGGSIVFKVLMLAALGLLGLAALSLVLRLAAVAVTLGLLAGAGLGVLWLVRKLLVR